MFKVAVLCRLRVPPACDMSLRICDGYMRECVPTEFFWAFLVNFIFIKSNRFQLSARHYPMQHYIKPWRLAVIVSRYWTITRWEQAVRQLIRTKNKFLKLLLTSAGISNPSIHKALVDLLGKPIVECSALFIPTAIYAIKGGYDIAHKVICGSLDRKSVV